MTPPRIAPAEKEKHLKITREMRVTYDNISDKALVSGSQIVFINYLVRPLYVPPWQHAMPHNHIIPWAVVPQICVSYLV